MKVSLNLINKFVKVNKSPSEIADRITLSLTEVEKVEKTGNDTVLTIENKALTHRSDCFSHLGIAREIAAYFDQKVNDPLTTLSAKKLESSEKMPFSLEIKDKNLCPRYSAVVLTNIKIAPSPKWLAEILISCGIRPINNVVDITNYVMIALGQPLHAFDYEKIDGQKIIVRKAENNEELTTLDGKKYELNKNTLVIADCRKPVGLAGIMGGKDSEVGEGTKTIILESANFEAKNNRSTAKALNIRTEASTRFEKKLDVTLTYPALMYAVELLKKYAQAKVASEVFDLNFTKTKKRELNVKIDWLNRFLGLNLSASEMVKILERLEFKVAINESELKIQIPSWRSDVTMPADIAEEIARIYGYDKIPTTLPLEEDKPPKANVSFNLRYKAKLFLSGLDFTEVLTAPFVGKTLLEKTQMRDLPHLQLVNPLTDDQEFMRRSLLPQLLSVLDANKVNFSEINIFEIDRCFLPKETMKLAGLTLNKNYTQTKGLTEAVLNTFFYLEDYEVKPYRLGLDNNNDCLFNVSHSAQFFLKGKYIGTVGQIKPEITVGFNLGEIYAFDLDFEELVQNAPMTFTYRPIPTYPPVIEDMTFVFPPETYLGEVIKTIAQTDPNVGKVELKDVYGESRTLRIYYQNLDRTLSNEEVKKIKEKIIAIVEKNFKVKIK